MSYNITYTSEFEKEIKRLSKKYLSLKKDFKLLLTELSEKVGLTLSNLSILKTGKAKAIRFSTLESICKVLDCQPADILEFVRE